VPRLSNTLLTGFLNRAYTPWRSAREHMIGRQKSGVKRLQASVAPMRPRRAALFSNAHTRYYP
jgi:hypothetical protein